MKDYANNKKRRRSVGGRSDRYNESERSLAKIVKSNRGRTSRSNNLIFNPMFIMVVLVGIVFAGAIFYVEYFRDFANDIVKFGNKTRIVAEKNIKNINKKPVEIAESNKNNNSNKTVPKFEFYHTLPKMVVGIDTNSTQVAKAEQPSGLSGTSGSSEPAVKSNKSSSDAYYLQIASFKNLKDAENLKAKLILSGFDIIIYPAKMANGETRYRVKSNKVDNIELALNLHSQLKVHQIESIILTDKG